MGTIARSSRWKCGARWACCRTRADSTSISRAVEELIDRLALRGVADRRAKGYSQGERLKVGLARALIHRPRTVILDEPTNGLDVNAVRMLRDLIRELRASGRCVLFSSHVMQEVAALCDDIVIIARGQVVVRGTPEEILAATGASDLEEAFVRAASEEGAA
jgi:sodium transport system ATP-binding protein